jgi:hypothetical protein
MKWARVHSALSRRPATDTSASGSSFPCGDSLLSHTEDTAAQTFSVSHVSSQESTSELQRECHTPVIGERQETGSSGGDGIYSRRMFGYRNWSRRCQFLVTQESKKLLDAVNLDLYHRRNLWKMLSFLVNEEHGFDTPASKKVIERLRSHLLFRCEARTKPVKADRISFFIEWTSKALRAIPIRTILSSEESVTLFPASLDLLRKVTVVRKLVKPLGLTMFNYSRVARKLDSTLIERLDTCPCRTTYHAVYRPNEGCVLTGDLGIVKQKALREVLMLGAKVRVRTGANPLDALKSALSDFIRLVSASEHIDVHLFTGWKQYILNAFTKRMNAVHIDGSDDTVVLSNSSLKYLRQLQKDLVLVPVDKAANNIAFVCKAFYVKTLQDELDGNASQVYEVADEGDLVVSARHTHTLKTVFGIDLKESDQRLAYLYWLPKLHKSPPSQRFIAGAARCTTTHLSKILSDCLTTILETLREKDNANILITSIRRFFVVKGFEEVASFLPRWPSQVKRSDGQSLQTGDFSTMYTTIPHKDLIDKLQCVFDETWGYVADLRKTDSDHVSLRWTKGSEEMCEWETSHRRPASFEHTKDVHRFTKLEMHKAISWLITNTFLVNGGKCRRQCIGIPMGTNCAPSVANLYLYAYESMYIDKLVEASLWDQAFSFHMTFRLIDDVLSKDNPYFLSAVSKSSEDGGLYPKALSLNITTVSNNVTHFLGMMVKDDKGKMCIEVFDKRKEFPFRVFRYPHRRSLIPAYIAYAVFQGLLHRYYRICTHWENFCLNTVLLARTLIDQGWSKSKLVFNFRKFLHTRLGLRWKIDLKLLFQRFVRQVDISTSRS